MKDDFSWTPIEIQGSIRMQRFWEKRVDIVEFYRYWQGGGVTGCEEEGLF